MNNLVFRRGTYSDEDALLALFQASYGKNFYLAWWAWWARLSPMGRNRVYAAEDPGNHALAGAYSLLPFKLWLNGRVATASLCNNVCTHPDYQRRGVFAGLGHYALSGDGHLGIGMSLGMPNAQALPGHLRVGWSVACRLPLMTKTGSLTQSHGCREVMGLDASVDRLIQRIKPKYALLGMRGAAWMRWRYSERPGAHYRFFVVDNYPEIHGYMVLKRYAVGDTHRIHIVDIHAETDKALHELIYCAEDAASGAALVNLYSNDHDPYKPTLEAHGFEAVQDGDCLIMHGNIGPTEMPDVRRGWCFNLGDNDVY